MPSAPIQIEASIQDGGWFCHAQSRIPVVFIVYERFNEIGENDTKTPVSMKIFDGNDFEKALV